MSAHSSHQSVASPLSAKRARPLKGRLRPPGDKSISHRAFLLGLLACGETKVEGLLEGDDVLRTGKACQALGAVTERLAPGAWRIRGPGIGALSAAARNPRFRQRRHRLPPDDGRRRRSRNHRDLDGDASLRKRPMRRILDPLRLMGAQVVSEAEGGRCPIVLKGPAIPRRSNIARRSPRPRSNRPSCSPASTRRARQS